MVKLKICCLSLILLTVSCGRQAVQTPVIEPAQNNPYADDDFYDYTPAPSPWVLPSSTPSPSPSPSASPSPSPGSNAPSITLVRLAPIASLGSQALVQLNSVGGTFNSLTLNGLTAPANVPLLVNPSSNSAVYQFDIKATGPGGSFSKVISFTVPTCQIAVNNLSTNSAGAVSGEIKLTTLNGAVAYAIQNGSIQSLNGNADIILPLSAIYQSTPINLRANVFSSVGDTTQCSTNFTPPAPSSTSTSIVAKPSGFIVAFDFGDEFRLPANGRSALSSLSVSSSSTYTRSAGISDFNMPVLTGALAGRVKQCAANEVQVGLYVYGFGSSALMYPFCQAIDARMKVTGIYSKSASSTLNSSLSCKTNEVMVGSTIPVGSGSYSISCGLVAWK